MPVSKAYFGSMSMMMDDDVADLANFNLGRQIKPKVDELMEEAADLVVSSTLQAEAGDLGDLSEDADVTDSSDPEQPSSDDLECSESSGSQDFAPSGFPSSEDFDSFDEKSSSGEEQVDSWSDSQSDDQLGPDQPMETGYGQLETGFDVGGSNTTQSALVSSDSDGLQGVSKDTNMLLQGANWDSSESAALVQPLQACGWSIDQCNTWLTNPSTADVSRAMQALQEAESASASIAMGAGCHLRLVSLLPGYGCCSTQAHLTI